MADGVVVRLFVLDFLERDADVPAEQLVLEPVRPRIRPDHGGREEGVDDLRCHWFLCLWVSICQRLAALSPWAGRSALLDGVNDRNRKMLSQADSRRQQSHGSRWIGCGDG